MSDTPRTDALWRKWLSADSKFQEIETVRLFNKLCRELERENAALRNKIKTLNAT